MDSMKRYFGALDFVIFGGALLLSSTFGILFGYRDRKSKSTDNYYFGGRKVSPIPVAISIGVSFISAITIVGSPVEIYLHGTVFAWYLVSLFMTNCVAILYYIPLFHRLKLNTINEYLEMRFHPIIRKMTSVIGMMNTMLYLAITIYLPSLALSAVTPLHFNVTIALISATCTFYTALGGMKAVIWTDVFQSIIMFTGMLAVFIKGTLIVGGFDVVMSNVEDGKRNNLFTFDLDPRIRSTAWTLTIGYFFVTCFEIVCGQIYIQRWLACRNVKTSRIAVALSSIPILFLTTLTILNGLVMYAYYKGCDPMMSKQIEKIDQLMPRFAVEIYHDTPGVAGLFVSAAFCGTLSTASSGINALSSLTMMDFILPGLPNLSSKRKIIMSKLLTVCFGVLVTLLAYAISQAQANITQAAASIIGFMGGPILGLVTMGIFMPWIECKGAMGGFIIGIVCTTWVGVSAIIYSLDVAPPLPLSVENCNSSIAIAMSSSNGSTESFTTSSWYSNSTQTMEGLGRNSMSIFNTLYKISPLHYSTLGFVMSIIGAHITSIFTGFCNPSKAKSDLFVPLIDNKILPQKVRTFFRFGVPVPSREKYEDEKMTEGMIKLSPTE